VFTAPREPRAGRELRGEREGIRLEGQRHVGAATAAEEERVGRRAEPVPRRLEALVLQRFARLAREARVDLGRAGVGDGIADDDVAVHGKVGDGAPAP
jgi:hypothetical protein